MRKHFIDNLRWSAVLLLIPYHAAMAWNFWEEPNYVFFGGNRIISSFIVFLSPYFMPLLFLLAGISTKYALEKRSYKQYISERAKRLLVPLISGTVILMPIMTFIADRFNYGYAGGFFEHYSVFFTKYTDLTGADGGFSFGQFWFLLFLFVISAVTVGVILLLKKKFSVKRKEIRFLTVILLCIPLPLFGELVSIGGKSILEYCYIFLAGYYLFSDDSLTDKTAKYLYITLPVGIIASIANVYMFIWSDSDFRILNTAAKYTAEWFMLLALIGIGKKYLDKSGRISGYMSGRSFPFFSFHFIWTVLFQYILSDLLRENTFLLYMLPVFLAYIFTFACCEICVRIPFLCFLTGTKYIAPKT